MEEIRRTLQHVGSRLRGLRTRRGLTLAEAPRAPAPRPPDDPQVLACQGALMARLSRRDEFEADAYASALLIKAGIGTGPQKSLFRKLEALTQNRADGIPAWLLSHPKIEERIAAIEENDRHTRGIVVLGLDAPEADLAASFDEFTGVPLQGETDE